MAIKYWVGTSATNRTALWNPLQTPTLAGPWSLTPGGTVRTTNPLVGDVAVFPDYTPLAYTVTNNGATGTSIFVAGLEFYGPLAITVNKTNILQVYGNMVGGSNALGQNPYFGPSQHDLRLLGNAQGPTAPAGDRYCNWGPSVYWGGAVVGASGGQNQVTLSANTSQIIFQSALYANLAFLSARSGTIDTGGYSIVCSQFSVAVAAAPYTPQARTLNFRGGTITCIGNSAPGGGGYVSGANMFAFTSDSASYGDQGGITLFPLYSNQAGVVSMGSTDAGPLVSNPGLGIPITYYNNPSTGLSLTPNIIGNIGYFSNFSFGGSYSNQIPRATTLTLKSLSTPTGFSIGNLSMNIASPGGTINTGSLTVGNATFNGIGGTTTLASTLTVSGNFSFLGGNINLNGKNLNVPTFVSNTSETREITSSTGIGNISPSSGNFYTDQGTFTTSSNVIINMPGGGVGVTLTNNSNVGDIRLASGSVLNIKTAAAANVTIRDITTSVRPANINMSTTGTFNLSNLSLAGNAGNAVTFQSNSAGTQFYISKPSGTITASFLNIKDSNDSGGATWLANNGTNSNGGNNTGWVFVAVVAGINGQFFVFF